MGIERDMCRKSYIKEITRGTQSHDAVDDSYDLKNVVSAMAMRQNKTSWNFLNVEGWYISQVIKTYYCVATGAVENF